MSTTPDFKTIVRRLWEDAHIDICDHCPNFGCSNCIVNDWKNEEEWEQCPET